MNKAYQPLLKRGLLVLLAVLWVLASARINGLQWLAFIWMLPLAFALQGASVRQALITCTVCAAMFWCFSVSWLLPAARSFTDVPLWLALLIYAAICLWQALPYVLFGALYAALRWDRHCAGPWLAAAALTVLWIIIPTPIPGLPQHALQPYPHLLAVLDISGISGVLFLSTLASFSLQRSVCGVPGSRRHYALLALLIPLLMLAYGAYRHWHYQQEQQQAGSEQWLKLAFVQPALVRADSTDRVFSLSQQAIQQYQPDLLIWPELPPAYSLIDNRRDQDATLALSTQQQQAMLVVSGYVYLDEARRGQVRRYANRAHLLQSGVLSGEYDKQQLVPFFEYMPPSLDFLRKWMPGTLNYRAGTNPQVMRYSEAASLITAICYEAIFPVLIREQVKQGGNVLVNPVSDTWFGDSAGSAYHFSLAYFRTLEHRIPWVRSANSGISAIVGADGSLLTDKTTLNTVDSASAVIFIPKQRSIYSRVGDWFTPFIGFLLLCFLLMHCCSVIRKRTSDE